MTTGILIALGGRRPRVDPTAWIAPTAVLVGDVVVGPEASVWYGCVLRGDVEPIEVGAGANVQDGCVVHTDPGAGVIIGREATIGHAAIVHGCRVGDGALIGMGACVLSGATIGEDAVVGARALVPERTTVPARTTVLGVPARPHDGGPIGLGRSISVRYRERAQLHRSSSLSMEHPQV